MRKHPATGLEFRQRQRRKQQPPHSVGAHFDPALTLRCPDTDRHRRFYERLGFVAVARLPRYHHGHDFVEYLREPLARDGQPEAR